MEAMVAIKIKGISFKEYQHMNRLVLIHLRNPQAKNTTAKQIWLVILWSIIGGIILGCLLIFLSNKNFLSGSTINGILIGMVITAALYQIVIKYYNHQLFKRLYNQLGSAKNGYTLTLYPDCYKSECDGNYSVNDYNTLRSRIRYGDTMWIVAAGGVFFWIRDEELLQSGNGEEAKRLLQL